MAVVALASIGGGTLAIMAGSGVEEKMKGIDGLVQKVRGYQSGAANMRTIEEKKKTIEEKKVEFESSLNVGLAMQKNNAFYEEVDQGGNVTTKPREPIMPDVLPEPKSDGVALSFKPRYLEEFKKLNAKLHARGSPTLEEITAEENVVKAMQEGEEEGDETALGGGRGAQPGSPAPSKKKETSLADFLRKSPQARAAEKVAAKIYMYVDDGAFGKHSLAERTEKPDARDIWHAQMSLWIQQDIATALYRCNEERAAQLRQEGATNRLWVAYMPVKRLLNFIIYPALGAGGGSNDRGATSAVSFTGVKNDEKRFVVPLQIQLVVEESAIMNVLGHLTSVGFYTPISVSYKAIEPDPLFERGFVYGDEPVVLLTVDLEGYYFRAAFEQWIPKDLKDALKTPNAQVEEPGGRRGGRG